METDKIVIYQTFDTVTSAYIIKGLLDSQGIQNFLGDENIASLYPIFNPAIGGIRLYVFEKDVERIDELIKSENIDLETS
jgi:hypothetical protein